MGILKSLFGGSVEKSFITDAEKVLYVCRSYGAVERGSLKACTTIALAFLALDDASKKDQTIYLILNAMESGRRLSDNEIGVLSKYNLRLMTLQRQSHESKSDINNRIASGIPIWIISIRALMYVALLPYARELWGILQNGDAITAYDEVKSVMRKLERHPLGDALSGIEPLMTPALFQPR